MWEFGGLWNENVWRRKPHIERLNLGIVEQGEKLWLYRVEEAVLMVEVIPGKTAESTAAIGQVVLKRLIDADRALERLTTAEIVGDGDR
ncbi:MAG: hypothetical protein SAJ37_21025 [Oscillatoria sp. PMC 1068.18]|nr:hypothetical protein [Oscillatoria sp. PMC 1068.18]